MSLVQDLFGGSIMSDEDTSLKGSSGNYGKFGLNKAKLVKVEFNPNAGKDGAPTNALDIEVNIGEKRFLQRQFEVSKIFAIVSPSIKPRFLTFLHINFILNTCKCIYANTSYLNYIFCHV